MTPRIRSGRRFVFPHSSGGTLPWLPERHAPRETTKRTPTRRRGSDRHLATILTVCWSKTFVHLTAPTPHSRPAGLPRSRRPRRPIGMRLIHRKRLVFWPAADSASDLSKWGALSPGKQMCPRSQYTIAVACVPREPTCHDAARSKACVLSSRRRRPSATNPHSYGAASPWRFPPADDRDPAVLERLRCSYADQRHNRAISSIHQRSKLFLTHQLFFIHAEA